MTENTTKLPLLGPGKVVSAAQKAKADRAKANKGRKLKRVLPKWAAWLLQPIRHKGVDGGRGGAKSHTVAELQLLLQVKNPNRRIVYIREVQKSLKDSVKALLEDKIRDMGIEKHFDIKSTEIRMQNGKGIVLFIGMTDHTAVTIKSLEGMDCAIIEEAQTISQKSLDMLLPTIRKEGSEIWALWNPQSEDDPIHKLFHGPNKPEDSICIRASYQDNPHASETMLRMAEHDRKTDYEKWLHVWGGECEKHSEARIFKKLRHEAFDTPKDIAALGGLRFGLDWGFSIDPLVLLRGFVDMAERRIYIEYEAAEVGCELQDTRALLLTVPGSERWTIIAGRDRPERIRACQRDGFKMKAAMGEKNSVIEGVEYLQNFEIIVHTRCPGTWEEFKNYKHPIDKLTGKPMPILPAKKNHFVEAARYMFEDVRRFEQGKELRDEDAVPTPIAHRWNNA